MSASTYLHKLEYSFIGLSSLVIPACFKPESSSFLILEDPPDPG